MTPSLLAAAAPGPHSASAACLHLNCQPRLPVSKQAAGLCPGRDGGGRFCWCIGKAAAHLGCARGGPASCVRGPQSQHPGAGAAVSSRKPSGHQLPSCGTESTGWEQPLLTSLPAARPQENECLFCGPRPFGPPPCNHQAPSFSPERALPFQHPSLPAATRASSWQSWT